MTLRELAVDAPTEADEKDLSSRHRVGDRHEFATGSWAQEGDTAHVDGQPHDAARDERDQATTQRVDLLLSHLTDDDHLRGRLAAYEVDDEWRSLMLIATRSCE